MSRKLRLAYDTMTETALVSRVGRPRSQSKAWIEHGERYIRAGWVEGGILHSPLDTALHQTRFDIDLAYG